VSELDTIMTQMSREDAAFGQAVSEKPPQLVSANPELDDMGLAVLKPHMSENAFNTFLTLLHWSIVTQDLSDGKPIVWNEATYAAMQAPFVGFGNAYMWESTYANNIGKIVHSHYFNWQTKGRRYRELNRLPHILLREIAPLMSNQGKGWKHAQYVQEWVMDAKNLEAF